MIRKTNMFYRVFTTLWLKLSGNFKILLNIFWQCTVALGFFCLLPPQYHCQKDCLREPSHAAGLIPEYMSHSYVNISRQPALLIGLLYVYSTTITYFMRFMTCINYNIQVIHSKEQGSFTTITYFLRFMSCIHIL